MWNICKNAWQHCHKKSRTFFLFLLILSGAAQAQLIFTTNNGAITITGYNGIAFGNLTIPGTTNGYPVTGIGVGAFKGQEQMDGVIIPDSITTIGSNAFLNCYCLSNVMFGNGFTSIGDAAFENCGQIVNVVIPDNVTSIGNGVFVNCSGLTNVTIGSGVTNISDTAFGSCAKLTNISVNPANSYYASAGGVLFNKAMTRLIQYPEVLAGRYTIPDGVTDIVATAFSYCHSLKGVTMPNSLTNIRNRQFESCDYMTNISMGSGVTSIGDYAFDGCYLLSSATISDSVNYLGTNAFNACHSLKNVTIGRGIKNIRLCAFGGCSRLPNVTIPDNVISISESAFGSCSSLTNVTFGIGVTSIGDGAFEYCTALTRVTIPSSVTNLGYRSFGFCSALTQAYFGGNAPTVSGGLGSADNLLFGGESGTAYYLPGTTGWGATFGGFPTAQWQPQMYPTGLVGPSTNGFGFNINWASGQTVVVEASTDFQNWIPVITNTLIGGTSSFSDAPWTNYPQRFYRIRSP